MGSKHSKSKQSKPIEQSHPSGEMWSFCCCGSYNVLKEAFIRPRIGHRHRFVTQFGTRYNSSCRCYSTIKNYSPDQMCYVHEHVFVTHNDSRNILSTCDCNAKLQRFEPFFIEGDRIDPDHVHVFL